MTELELAQQLLDAGFAVGKSKSGKLLRIDNRECPSGADLVAGSGLVLQALGLAASLKELYWRDSGELPNQHIDQLCSLQKLKVLDVEGSAFNDASVEELSGNGELQILAVRGTNVTEPCVTQVRKKMINTRIIF